MKSNFDEVFHAKLMLGMGSGNTEAQDSLALWAALIGCCKYTWIYMRMVRGALLISEGPQVASRTGALKSPPLKCSWARHWTPTMDCSAQQGLAVNKYLFVLSPFTLQGKQITLLLQLLKSSRSTSSYRATEWRDMSFLDLLFLKNSENVVQIFDYIFSRSQRFQMFASGGRRRSLGQMWVGGQIHVILWFVDVKYWEPTDI